jgi:hypothetical protein
MRKKNKLDPCPLCGSKRKAPTTASLRNAGAKTAGLSGVSAPTESSDDRTANEFAALLLAGRSSQL